MNNFFGYAAPPSTIGVGLSFIVESSELSSWFEEGLNSLVLEPPSAHRSPFL